MARSSERSEFARGIGRRSTAEPACGGLNRATRSRRFVREPVAARSTTHARSATANEFAVAYQSECRPEAERSAQINNPAAFRPPGLFRLASIGLHGVQTSSGAQSTGAARWYSHMVVSLDHLRSKGFVPAGTSVKLAAGFLFPRASPGAHRPSRPCGAFVAVCCSVALGGFSTGLTEAVPRYLIIASGPANATKKGRMWRGAPQSPSADVTATPRPVVSMIGASASCSPSASPASSIVRICCHSSSVMSTSRATDPL